MRAIAIDYGRRRIGLAVSDATGMLARPWKTIARVGPPAAVADAIATEIASLEADGAITAVVVGLPRRLNGEPNEQTAHVQTLIERLRARLPIPIVAQDERLTSYEAEALVSRHQKDWRKRKPLIDATAAAVILQDYLDGQARTRPIDFEGEDV